MERPLYKRRKGLYIKDEKFSICNAKAISRTVWSPNCVADTTADQGQGYGLDPSTSWSPNWVADTSAEASATQSSEVSLFVLKLFLARKSFKTNKVKLQNKQGKASKQTRKSFKQTRKSFKINKEKLQNKQGKLQHKLILVCFEAFIFLLKPGRSARAQRD